MHTKYTKYYDILIGGQSCLVQQGWDRVVGEYSTQYQNRCTHHCSITILLYDGSMKWLSHMLSHWFTFPLNLSVVTTTLLSSFTTVSKTIVSVLFTARSYASAVLAMGLCLSVCLCLSVTSRCSTKTAKRRITQTPHDTPGTLVFWCLRSPQNSTGVTPYEGAECRWGGSKSATFDIYPAISRKR